MMYLLVAAAATLLIGETTTADQRPNIVVVVADDLGWSDVGFHSGDVMTPNIDALAYNGVILKRHYSQPLCTPSRTALLTGDYPIRHGMQGDPCLPGVADGLPLGLKLLPEALGPQVHQGIELTGKAGVGPDQVLSRSLFHLLFNLRTSTFCELNTVLYFQDLGYSTHLVGKWHLGYETEDHLPTRRGFDTFFGYLNGYLSYWDGTHFYDDRAGRDIRRGERGAWREVYGRYLTEVLTEEAVHLIDSHDTTNGSMLLFLCQNAVHTTPLSVEKEAPEFVANHTKRGILREMALWMDWSVGEVVSALQRKNMINNTIIVFISDNGSPSKDTLFENSGSNWPFRGQKVSTHEGGIRAVGLIYSPLIPLEPRVTDQMFHMTDWFPTLYTAAGGNVNDLKYKDGIDQWSSLITGSAGPRNELLVNIDDIQNTEAYISGRWKLVKNNNPNGGEVAVDRYTGVSPDWMKYDVEKVKNSSAAITLGGLPPNWAELKEAATVKGGCPKGSGDPTTYDCHSKHCLFDLEADTSECVDVAAENPIVVSTLQSRLDYYRRALVPPPLKIFDRKAEPRFHQDYWSPWMASYN